MRLFIFPILILLFIACREKQNNKEAPFVPLDLCDRFPCESGAAVRGDTSRKKLTLVFTGDTFGDGGLPIRSVLQKQNVKAAFFLTGNFYRKPDFKEIIEGLRADGHYLGAHSDRHLLYCPWENRDSLLVSRENFLQDLEDNYREMARFGVQKEDALFFLPPYEWYNESIGVWTAEYGLHLINYTPGTRSHADYTTPEMKAYLSSDAIFQSIVDYELEAANGLNGFLLLSHIGVDPKRRDKFYTRLEDLIIWLKGEDYVICPIGELFAW